MMPSIFGHITLKKRIAARVLKLIMLYASLKWSEELYAVTTRRTLFSVYSAIRLISGLRTVFNTAIFVLAKAIQIY